MGMNAIVKIWVGIRFDYIPEEIPEEVRNACGVERERLTGYEGFSLISCSDEICGAGVVILSHDWDYGVATVNLEELLQDSKRLIYPMEQLFKEWGIDSKVDVYIQTNYW